MISFKQLLDALGWLFFLTSPLTSYGDQIFSMHRRKSSAGFSIDVCGIMLAASILRVFFWFGDRYELSLLGQSILMIVVQCVLLKMCLDYRPSSVSHPKRPLHLWAWSNPNTYWEFLSGLVVSLSILQYAIGTIPMYVQLVGVLALGIEALLPIPQFLSNYRHKSVSGFRPSVVIAWLAGDIFKTSYFFFGEANVTWQFKMCAVVQFVFDIGIAVQFCVYGGKSAWTLDGKLGQEIEQELEEGLGAMRR